MKLTSCQIAYLIHNITSHFPRTDGSLVPVWCDLNDEQKQHAAQAVEKIMSSESRTPEELHNLWMEPLVSNGWTKGEYNLNLKQHPSIMPFDELPDSEILKDELWYHLTECFRKYYTSVEEEASDLL
jgi:RyR domain